MSVTETTLYDRLGGETSIANLIDKLYQRVLDDPDLQPFFASTPMEKLRSMQHEYLCAALGGPMIYRGKPLSYVHQGKGIKIEHFAKFAQHLLDALHEIGVSADDADEVIARLNTRVNQITGKSY